MLACSRRANMRNSSASSRPRLEGSLLLRRCCRPPDQRVDAGAHICSHAAVRPTKKYTLSPVSNKHRRHSALDTSNSPTRPTKPGRKGMQPARRRGEPHFAPQHRTISNKTRDRPRFSISFSSKWRTPFKRVVDRLELAAANLLHCRHPRAASGRHQHLREWGDDR